VLVADEDVGEDKDDAAKARTGQLSSHTIKTGVPARRARMVLRVWRAEVWRMPHGAVRVRSAMPRLPV